MTKSMAWKVTRHSLKGKGRIKGGSEKILDRIGKKIWQARN
jgi:hypothetical protein